jgi:hypothetical protein
MAYCYSCEKELTSLNSSEEHIILNSCGGRLKSRELLCKSCNQNFGTEFDSELARNTNVFMNLLNIKREKGSVQPIKGKFSTTNMSAIMKTIRKGPVLKSPIIKENRLGDMMHVSVKARNDTEAKKILLGLKRKYPKINIEELINSSKNKPEYIQSSMEFSIESGSSNERKAFIKTAINYYVYSGGDRRYVSHIIPYLNGKTDMDITYMYYPDKPVYVPDNKEVSHLILLGGDPKFKILLCYIELFNALSYLIVLNAKYDGATIDKTYCFDLIHRKELKKEINAGFDLSYFSQKRDVAKINENMHKKIENTIKKIRGGGAGIRNISIYE